MRRIILCLLVCLLLTGCTVGIARRDDLTPVVSTALTSPSPPTDTPQPEPAREDAHHVELVSHTRWERWGISAVFVRGNYAYVGDTEGHLTTLDVSDPAHPVRVSDVELPGAVHDVRVANDFAYVTTLGSCEQLDWDCRVALRILDVSNPGAPFEIGAYEWPQIAQMPWNASITVADNAIYVADASTGLLVLDVSDPTAPVEVSRYEGLAWDVEMTGNYAHAIYSRDDWDHGYWQVLDVSVPTAPVEVGSYDISDNDWSSGADVAVLGDYGYVADGRHGLRILDISNPVAPFRVGSYDAPKDADGLGAIVHVAVADGYVYVDSYYAGTSILRVLDVSDPIALSEVGSYDIPSPVWDVAVADGYIYVCSEDLYILRHTRPEQ